MEGRLTPPKTNKDCALTLAVQAVPRGTPLPLLPKSMVPHKTDHTRPWQKVQKALPCTSTERGRVPGGFCLPPQLGSPTLADSTNLCPVEAGPLPLEAHGHRHLCLTAPRRERLTPGTHPTAALRSPKDGQGQGSREAQMPYLGEQPEGEEQSGVHEDRGRERRGQVSGSAGRRLLLQTRGDRLG
jgi:hypothetical protein